MLTEFAEYYGFIGQYVGDTQKLYDLSKIKTQAIVDTLDNQNIVSKNVLTVGFGVIPIGMSQRGYNVTICNCTNACMDFIDSNNLNIEYLDIGPSDLYNSSKKYDIVIAPDEYLTYAGNENQQRNMTNELLSIAKQSVITTVRDFKNMPKHLRNFDEPIAFIYNNDKDVVFFNRRKWHKDDKQLWDNFLYSIDDEGLQILGPITRRTLFFKQLAKYCHDYGVKDYRVQKNLFYKGLFSKTFEHIVSINV